MAEQQRAAEKSDTKTLIRAEKIYLKDVSFETPNSPEIFTLDWHPELTFDVEHTSAKLPGENLYEVVITITAVTKIKGRTAYLAEVHQAGIFTLPGADQERIDRLLNVFCSRTIYPYACAAMTDIVSKGGFPQLLLPPISFDAMYKQRLENAQETESS